MASIYCVTILLVSYGGCLLPAFNSSIQNFFFTSKWTLNGLKNCFIVVVFTGLIAGIIIGLLKPQIINKYATLIIFFALPTLIVAWFIYATGIRVSTPHSIKLADYTSNAISIHLQVPKGHAYQLELQVPGIQFSPSNGKSVSSYKFSGHLRILTAGAQFADLSIGSDKAWLIRSGYVLTGVGLQNTNVLPLSDFIQSDKSYDFEISLDPAPPPSSSIWLFWREAKIDK